MSETGWSFTAGDWKTGGKGLTEWAKASAGASPQVITSSGYTVDFWSRNFDVKHLMIVENASDFSTIVTAAMQRQALRQAGTLLGHNNAPVSHYAANSVLVLTLGMLAAWGGMIAKSVAGRPADGMHGGQPQWHVTSKLRSAAFMTHSNKASHATQGGMGATVSLACTMKNCVICVVHLRTQPGHTHSDPKRRLDVSGAASLFTEAEAKRRARFLKGTDSTEPDLGIGSLWD